MDEKRLLLERILSKVGDLGLRRRILTILDYLDIEIGDRILDCGCGEGFYTMIISELFDVQITAFDVDSELLERASNWIENREAVRFVKGDIRNGLPFGDNTFDKIICSELLEHLDKDLEALKEIYRVLKPGGIVGLTVPNENYPFLWDPLNWTREHLGLSHFNPKNTILGGVWSLDHKRLYSVGTIRKLSEEVGFQVLSAEALTHYCFPFNYHILRLGKLLYSGLPVPETVRQAMEKFEWKKENQNKNKLGLVKAIFSIFKWIDSENDRHSGLNGSSVSISLKLGK